MVKRKDSFLQTEAAPFSVDSWLAKISYTYSEDQVNLVQKACTILQDLVDKASPEAAGILSSSLEIATILVELNLDYEALVAAILYESLVQEKISLEQIKNLFGPIVSSLLEGVLQLNNIRNLQNQKDKNRSHDQVDKLRKMLIAMVDDVRVVLIKLAERLRILRIANSFTEEKRLTVAQEVKDIYAPLANRLGVWQIKWELEDLAFRYLQPDTYKKIAKAIKNRRIERDELIQAAMAKLRSALLEVGIKKFDISGRAKHIYSIYKKMQRKDVDYQEIYDANAIRVLVPEIDDCYMVLGIVHDLWQQIPKEFDDYIQNPKPNGYRSIHTAVIGPGENNLEVQIRTYRMHEESELGVAAHWAYKEGKAQKPQQIDKITWLRQVLDWQKELITDEHSAKESSAFDEQVYVFSPAGDVIDLPKNATPLDFAYTIHSQIGHRCRGAKVNGNIVPLTYQLQTGDQVEILTGKQPNPSRDWLNPHAGYITTARARAKVQHWFKLQDHDRHVADGHELIVKELQRLGLHEINLDELANKLHYANNKDMYAALGSGSIRLSQITGAINQLKVNLPSASEPQSFITKTTSSARTSAAKSAVSIAGINDLLTHLAGCCKPVPGDAIVGYITQAHGISIHRQDCSNIKYGQQDTQRLIDVDWNAPIENKYPVDLHILANDRHGLLRDITTALTAEKINISNLNSTVNHTEIIAIINLTIEVKDIKQLDHITHKIKQLPNIVEVKRIK